MGCFGILHGVLFCWPKHPRFGAGVFLKVVMGCFWNGLFWPIIICHAVESVSPKFTPLMPTSKWSSARWSSDQWVLVEQTRRVFVEHRRALDVIFCAWHRNGLILLREVWNAWVNEITCLFSDPYEFCQRGVNVLCEKWMKEIICYWELSRSGFRA